MDRSWGSITLLLALLMITSTAQAAKKHGPCGADLSGLMMECGDYVVKSGPNVPPSKTCCTYVRPIDVACACGYVTKDAENMVSMEKVVYVARYCGKKVPSGTVCGSYKVTRA